MGKAIVLSRLAGDYLLALSYAGVTCPLDLFDLAGSYIDLKRAVIPDGTFRVFQRNSVVTGRQRNPKAPLIVGIKRGNNTIFLFYDEGRIRKRARIGNAHSRWSTLDGAHGNDSFEPCSGFRRKRGLRLCNDDATKQSEKHQNYQEGSLFVHEGIEP
jgi:hypothetical protein